MSPRGVAPKRMPKADATGLAPNNRHDLSWAALVGEASERRPWASKRERSPGGVCPAFLLNSQLVALEIARASVNVGVERSEKPAIHWLFPPAFGALCRTARLPGSMFAFAAGWQSVTCRY